MPEVEGEDGCEGGLGWVGVGSNGADVVVLVEMVGFSVRLAEAALHSGLTTKVE